MNKNCDIVRDLIPMYAENLTSEESNKFIAAHLSSCEDCTNYLMNVQRDLPKNDNDSFDIEVDNDDQKLMKGIKFSLFKTMVTAILLGVLVGIFGSMMFFNFNINEVQAVFVFYSIVNFFIGLLSFVLLKRIWMGPLLTLISGIISSIIFSNISFWIWIIVYTFVSLLGSLTGKGIEKIKSSKVKVTLKALISVVGAIITLIILLVLSFIMGMTPDSSEERKVIE